MATGTQIPVEQYLSTSYERESEYIRGEIVEKPMGNLIHSIIQQFLSVRLHAVGLCCPELRLRLAEDLVLVPDLSVFVTSRPTEQVPTRPPDIVVEIVSPDQRYPEMLEKLEEYRRWGVPHIWVVEPQMQRLQIYTESGLANVSQIELPERGFALSASELFDYVSARRPPQ
jgi:Uma2 family endonuclease